MKPGKNIKDHFQKDIHPPTHSLGFELGGSSLILAGPETKIKPLGPWCLCMDLDLAYFCFFSPSFYTFYLLSLLSLFFYGLLNKMVNTQANAQGEAQMRCRMYRNSLEHTLLGGVTWGEGHAWGDMQKRLFEMQCKKLQFWNNFLWSSPAVHFSAGKNTEKFPGKFISLCNVIGQVTQWMLWTFSVPTITPPLPKIHPLQVSSDFGVFELVCIEPPPKKFIPPQRGPPGLSMVFFHNWKVSWSKSWDTFKMLRWTFKDLSCFI